MKKILIPFFFLILASCAKDLLIEEKINLDTLLTKSITVLMPPDEQDCGGSGSSSWNIGNYVNYTSDSTGTGYNVWHSPFFAKCKFYYRFKFTNIEKTEIQIIHHEFTVEEIRGIDWTRHKLISFWTVGRNIGVTVDCYLNKRNPVNLTIREEFYAVDHHNFTSIP